MKGNFFATYVCPSNYYSPASAAVYPSRHRCTFDNCILQPPQRIAIGFRQFAFARVSTIYCSKLRLTFKSNCTSSLERALALCVPVCSAKSCKPDTTRPTPTARRTRQVLGNINAAVLREVIRSFQDVTATHHVNCTPVATQRWYPRARAASCACNSITTDHARREPGALNEHGATCEHALGGPAGAERSAA
jgi:hypothetical protein